MYKRLFFSLFMLILFISGCATIPTGENIATYSIGGVTYYPLVTLCDLRGVGIQYDALLRTAYLSRDAQQVSLRVGDNLVLVNNNALHLNSPIDVYQGTIAVPRQFKEQVFDALFKRAVLAGRRAGTGKIKLNKVVIDAGHGGNDPGAIGKNGLKEKDVNLDIAKRLSSLLRAEGVQTVLTRSTDKFIPLSTRVNIANKSGAALFISIHSNANRSRSLSGFEVYYVASSVSDSKRAVLTARSTALNLKDANFASNSQDLKTIVWDMIYTNSRAESIELSHSLCKVMNSSIDANILGVKNARFQVLKGITMPGILIEVGFVSNLNEERLLKTAGYREKLAVGILEGIRDYSQDMALVEVALR
ncbi:MAG: N-acetylmuramoyl-L-alanine amidase [Candidatus Omnitrophica bacterium]|nr:N-acetylmuramoyl-L-alanine amidase [Candidatus Omnitrophota bacterium]MBU4303847.1 N-acetylmuramoyl-L-alanine amidase [Candidatus Omnitrophota bacterium]MBU4419252.1 N-acetylmuramoyl-L-alanine amidase [Candidatus Omnitrophota bacterium]MBU4468038.1 N-acetylmuramoyl-L-alanine amidase [Candidatus Omnitrophota bacterium]MCG2707835.1 N-acetylmuramoyl-L-alanine amidase [Candidatus Omnitrophota bacterium]